MDRWLGRWLDRWLATVHRHAVVTIAAACVATALAAVYVVQTIAINTSTTDMISPEVPFRQHSIAFDQAFPQLNDNIVAVIDAPSFEGADIAATALAEALAERPRQFVDVRLPGGEQYFHENGLMLLGLDELYDLADRLAGAEPLLNALARDPNLRGLTDILTQAFEADDVADRESLIAALDEMSEVTVAAADGRPMRLSWAGLLDGNDTGDGDADTAYGHRRFVIVRPVLDFGSLKPAAAAIDTLRAAARDVGIGPATGTRLRLTGGTAIEQEELETVQLGGQLAGYLSLVLVAILLLLCLRSLRLVAVTVLTLLMGLVWTAALAAATVGELNLISVAFAVLFIGLGVDFGIHFALRFLETEPDARADARALKLVGRSVGGALALSAVCAAAGFFAFLPTDYDGLAELGLIAGMGMFVALFANLTVLPAWLAVVRPKNRIAAASSLAARLSGATRGRARAVLIGAGAVSVACLALVPTIEFDFNPINLRDPGTESVATFRDLAADPSSSFYAADLIVENVAAIDETAATLSQLPEVEDIVSVKSFVPANQDDKLLVIDDLAFFLAGILTADAAAADNGPAALDDAERVRLLSDFRSRLAARAEQADALGAAAGRFAAALDRLAGDDGTIAARDAAALESRLLDYLPHLFERLTTALNAEPVSLDELPDEIVSQWVTPDGRARLLVQPAGGIADNDDVAAFADAVLSVAPRATGTPIIVTEAGRVILRAFLTATAFAFAAIVVILFAVVRRPADVALILLPLIFAAALTVATAALFGLAFNFANIIVLPLLLGLGIASAIHLVLRWRRQGADLAVATSSTPRAVMFSALTTVAAFGSLAVSGHLGMRSMGLLLAIALMATLIATLVVLPGLMTLVGGRVGGRTGGGEAARPTNRMEDRS